MKEEMTPKEWKKQLELFERERGEFISKQSFNRRFGLLKEFIEFAVVSGRVLDIGCGSGDFKRFSNLENYVGIDPIALNTKDFLFVQGIGEYLPFRDGIFDCAVSMAALDHCLDPVKIFDECKRVLKDSGRFYIWLSVIRTDPRYKIKRALYYLSTFEIRSLIRSLRANINIFGKDKRRLGQEYGHTYSFTETSLIEFISKYFKIEKVGLHDQDVFIAVRK